MGDKYWFTVEVEPDGPLTRDEVKEGLNSSDVNVILMDRTDEVHLRITVVQE